MTDRTRLAPRKDRAASSTASPPTLPGVNLLLRAGQKLALDTLPAGTLIVVQGGVLLLRASWPGQDGAILSILYAGDVLSARSAPDACSASILAAMPAGLRRIAASSLDDAAPAVMNDLLQRLQAQQARQCLHSARVTGLVAEIRAASLLMELAVRLGEAGPGGRSFEMPLTRVEMAEYLGLNADTLSRIMTQLESKGIVGRPNRRRVLIRNWRALEAMTPHAASIAQMHRSRPAASGSAFADEVASEDAD